MARHSGPGVFTNSAILLVSPGSQQLAEPPPFVPPPAPPLPQVATPVILPVAGSYSPNVTVTITCSTPGATIYYTTDGTQPSTNSSVYTGSFILSSSATVRAFATLAGFSDSAFVSSVYTVSAGNNPDWSTLDVWNTFLPNTVNGVPGAFSGWSQAGATFMVYIDDRNLGGGASNIKQGAFFVMYNGPGRNCLVTVDMSQWAGATADGDAVGKFEITQGDGNTATVLATAIMSNYDRSISGNTLLVPFTLGPGVPGVSDTIIIQGAFSQASLVDAWIDVFLNEAVRFQITATVSNV